MILKRITAAVFIFMTALTGVAFSSTSLPVFQHFSDEDAFVDFQYSYQQYAINGTEDEIHQFTFDSKIYYFNLLFTFAKSTFESLYKENNKSDTIIMMNSLQWDFKGKNYDGYGGIANDFRFIKASFLEEETNIEDRNSKICLYHDNLFLYYDIPKYCIYIQAGVSYMNVLLETADPYLADSQDSDNNIYAIQNQSEGDHFLGIFLGTRLAWTLKLKGITLHPYLTFAYSWVYPVSFDVKYAKNLYNLNIGAGFVLDFFEHAGFFVSYQMTEWTIEYDKLDHLESEMKINEDYATFGFYCKY